MFVRVKKVSGYEYLYLGENVRDGGRHVQRVIKALGRRDEVAISGLLHGLIASAARDFIVLVQLLPGRTGGTAPPQHRPRSGVRPSLARDRVSGSPARHMSGRQITSAGHSLTASPLHQRVYPCSHRT
jgi:hypothetical protein